MKLTSFILGLVSMILAILAGIFIGAITLIIGIIAVILGIIGLAKNKEDSKIFAVLGMIFGAIGSIISIIVIIFVIIFWGGVFNGLSGAVEESDNGYFTAGISEVTLGDEAVEFTYGTYELNEMEETDDEVVIDFTIENTSDYDIILEEASSYINYEEILDYESCVRACDDFDGDVVITPNSTEDVEMVFEKDEEKTFTYIDVYFYVVDDSGDVVDSVFIDNYLE